MRYGIRAPVLGSVNTVFVENGAKVTKGDIILTIESMKMTFEVVVPTDGVVELCTQLGEVVDMNQVIAYINQ